MSAECNSSLPSTSTDSKSSFGVSESRLGNYYGYAASQTLEKFLSSIKYSLFKAKFPEICKECKIEITDLSKDLRNQLKATITSDLKKITTENELFSSLKSLDDMIRKQKDRAGKDSWRPSGNPENDVRDRIYFLKERYKKVLQFTLETLVVENNKLETTVEENHGEILELKKEIDYDNQEVQSNFAAFNSLDIKSREDIHTMF